jgi:hypothetical protein
MPMKLSRERVHTLSRSLVERLAAGRYLEVQGDPGPLSGAVEEAIAEELMIEDRLNEEVRKILEPHEAEIEKGGLDYREMFQMTKKQLAKKRGLIL